MGIIKKIHHIHFEQIDSTNTWAKKEIASFDREALTCVKAAEQTAGRGRFARKWVSPKGGNIYASLCFFVPMGAPYVANLGQVLSLSCCTVVRRWGVECEVKWPNDVLVGGKKIAGVLCETVQCGDKLGVVLGIGVNVNMTPEWLGTIDQPATSLGQVCGKEMAVEEVLEALVQQFVEDFGVLEKRGFKAFVTAYNGVLAFKSEQVCCVDGAEIVRGVCAGVGPDGRLQLRLDNGSVRTFGAGEVTVRVSL